MFWAKYLDQVLKFLINLADFQFYGSALSVSKKLAACVNIIPGLTSVYEWEGKINTDDEVLMMIKTRFSFCKKHLVFL